MKIPNKCRAMDSVASFRNGTMLDIDDSTGEYNIESAGMLGTRWSSFIRLAAAGSYQCSNPDDLCWPRLQALRPLSRWRLYLAADRIHSQRCRRPYAPAMTIRLAIRTRNHPRQRC